MADQAHGQLETAMNATGSSKFRPDSRLPIGSETHARLSTESHNELLEKVVITNDIVIAWPIRLSGVPVQEPEMIDLPLKRDEQPTTDVTDPATNCKLSMSVRMEGVSGPKNLNVHTRVQFRGNSPEYNVTVQNAIGPFTFNGSDRIGTETTELQISVSPAPIDQPGNQWQVTRGMLQPSSPDGAESGREQLRTHHTGLLTEGQENDQMAKNAITPVLRTDNIMPGNQKERAIGQATLCTENPQQLIQSTQLNPDGTCIKVDTLVPDIPNETTIVKLDQVISVVTTTDHELELKPQVEAGPESKQGTSSNVPTEVRLGEQTNVKSEINETSDRTGVIEENIIPSFPQTTELSPAEQKERIDETVSAPTTVKDAQETQSQLSADAALPDVEPVVTNAPEVQLMLGETEDRIDLLNSENVVNLGDEAQNISPTREEHVSDARTPENETAIALLENITQPDNMKLSHLTSSSHRSDEDAELDQKYKMSAKALAKGIIDKVKLMALEHEIPSNVTPTSQNTMSDPKIPQQLSEQSILSPQSGLSESKQEEILTKASSPEEVAPSGLVSEDIPLRTESPVKTERVLHPSDSALQYTESGAKQNNLTQAVNEEDQEESEWSHSMYHYRHYYRRVRPNDPSSPSRTTRKRVDYSSTDRHHHHEPGARHGRSHTVPRPVGQVCDCQHCMANKLCEIVRATEQNGIEDNTDEPSSGSLNSEISEIHKATMTLLTTLATTAKLLRNQYRRQKTNRSRMTNKQSHTTPTTVGEQDQKVQGVADPETADASVTARNMSCALSSVFTEPRKCSQTTAGMCHKYCCKGNESHALGQPKTIGKKETNTSKEPSRFKGMLASSKYTRSELNNCKQTDLAAPMQWIFKTSTQSSKDSTSACCTNLISHEIPHLRYMSTTEEVVETESPETGITIQERTGLSDVPLSLRQQRKTSKNRWSHMKTGMNTN